MMAAEDKRDRTDFRKTLFGLNSGESRSPDEIRDAVYLTTGDTLAKQSRFWLLLVLSAGIATAGVIADSTATVIGAMIVAPLATPIQGVAVAIAYGEVKQLFASAGTLLLAMGVVIGIAAVGAWILPELEPLSQNSQVTGRVSPTLVDLVAATVTGLAGSFAIARRDIGDILPGVAIAISLVPPLAVVGVTAMAGDWDGAFGSLLLFLTNMLAIIVVGIIIFSTLQLLSGRRPEPALGSAFLAVGVASFVVVVALGLTTYHTVQKSNWIGDATEIGKTWAEKYDERLLAARFEGDDLIMVVEGNTDGSQDSELPRLLAGDLPDGTPVIVNRVPGDRNRVGEIGP